MNLSRWIVPSALLLAAALPAGCSSLYYGTMETFGYHKRDLLVERVEEAKVDQEQAKEQFQTAFEQFKQITAFDGGDLEDQYNQLKSAFERCADRADDVRDRIKAVRDVSDALFAEWRSELDQYKSEDLRRQSEKLIDSTERQADQLIAAMQSAEAKMQPVLDTFSDQVLFLKHNLNARAIASLSGISTELEKNVAALIADMEKSIDEASAFIDSLKTPE